MSDTTLLNELEIQDFGLRRSGGHAVLPATQHLLPTPVDEDAIDAADRSDRTDDKSTRAPRRSTP